MKWSKKKKYLSGVCILLLSAVLLAATYRNVQKGEVYEVACIGDSITYGVGVELTRGTDSYPAQLERFLGENYKVYNYGKSGRTLLAESDKPYRKTGYIETVKSQEPDIIVIMLGTNDSKPQNWQAEEYHRQYVELVEELKTIPGEPEIYLAKPPAVFEKEDGQAVYGIDGNVIAHEICPIVEQTAEETGAHVIDMYAATEGHPEYYVDGVHFNKDGNTVLARTVYEIIYQ